MSIQSLGLGSALFRLGTECTILLGCPSTLDSEDVIPLKETPPTVLLPFTSQDVLQYVVLCQKLDLSKAHLVCSRAMFFAAREEAQTLDVEVFEEMRNLVQNQPSLLPDWATLDDKRKAPLHAKVLFSIFFTNTNVLALPFTQRSLRPPQVKLLSFLHTWKLDNSNRLSFSCHPNGRTLGTCYWEIKQNVIKPHRVLFFDSLNDEMQHFTRPAASSTLYSAALADMCVFVPQSRTFNALLLQKTLSDALKSKTPVNLTGVKSCDVLCEIFDVVWKMNKNNAQRIHVDLKDDDLLKDITRYLSIHLTEWGSSKCSSEVVSEIRGHNTSLRKSLKMWSSMKIDNFPGTQVVLNLSLSSAIYSKDESLDIDIFLKKPGEDEMSLKVLEKLFDKKGILWTGNPQVLKLSGESLEIPQFEKNVLQCKWKGDVHPRIVLNQESRFQLECENDDVVIKPKNFAK